MRRILLASMVIVLSTSVTPTTAEVIATKADCEGLATGLEAYAAAVSAFRKSAASLVAGSTEAQEGWPAEIKQSIAELAATRDEMLPPMDAFLKALNDSTAMLHKCPGAVE